MAAWGFAFAGALALAAVAVPAAANDLDLGTPPAGDVAPEGWLAGERAPPPPRPHTALPVIVSVPDTASALPRASARSIHPPPPPPPTIVPDVPTASVVPLEARFVPDAPGEAARHEEVVAVPPCVPCRPSVCTTGCDPLLKRDRTRQYRNAWFGGSLSFLPQIGVALEIGGVYRRTPTRLWSWEVEFTWQFLDDELFADDGNPTAGDWFQIQAGVKMATRPLARRHWVARAGAVWFYAGDEPNIVQSKGHYGGIYISGGYETDLTPNLTMGPELTGLLVLDKSGRFYAVPQLNWHVIWSF